MSFIYFNWIFSKLCVWGYVGEIFFFGEDMCIDSGWNVVFVL